jgi:hypothetical protein
MDYIPSSYRIHDIHHCVQGMLFSVHTTHEGLPLMSSIKIKPHYNGYGQEDPQYLPKPGLRRLRRYASVGEFRSDGEKSRLPSTQSSSHLPSTQSSRKTTLSELTSLTKDSESSSLSSYNEHEDPTYVEPRTVDDLFGNNNSNYKTDANEEDLEENRDEYKHELDDYDEQDKHGLLGVVVGPEKNEGNNIFVKNVG